MAGVRKERVSSSMKAEEGVTRGEQAGATQATQEHLKFNMLAQRSHPRAVRQVARVPVTEAGSRTNTVQLMQLQLES